MAGFRHTAVRRCWRAAKRAIAVLCLGLLQPAVSFGQADDPQPADVFLTIEYSAAGLRVSGSASSQAHPTILGEVVRQSLGEAATNDVDIDLSTGQLTPAGWSLVTEMVLRAVLTTRQGSAIVTPSSVALQGITTDRDAWDSALKGVQRASLDNMSIRTDVLEAAADRDYRELCIDRFSQLTSNMPVRFGSSSAAIGGDTYRALDALVELAIQCPDLNFDIVGHTDASGSADANHAISADRAQSVKSYLLARGLPPSRVSSRAAGATEPFSTATDLYSRRLNRRVEIRLMKP